MTCFSGREEDVTNSSQKPVSDDFDVMQDAVRTLLLELGEDPFREGLQRTPLRVAKALKFATSGKIQVF